MSRNLFYLSLLSVSIMACSTNTKEQAHGSFDYATKDEAKSLIIPEKLKKPEQKRVFYVPSVEETNSPVGANMDIRAPALVIPIAAASRVEGNEGEAQVWFDQVIDDRNLLDFIRGAIKSQLDSDGVALNSIGSDDLVYESDWYKSEKESGWLFKEIEETESMRFRYTLESKPHGRSVAIKVDLIDYNKKDLTGSVNKINTIEQHRAEMTMLNKLIGEVDYQYRTYKHELLIAKAKKINVALGLNTDNEASLIANMDLDSLWANIPSFFADNGITITDLNESKYIYFVTLEKQEPGFWESLWGDEKQQLKLADGKYRFVLEDIDNTTAITILDNDGTPLPSEILADVLPVLQSGLSFENLF